MNCITLWQPWASWIARGWKTIETRTHQRFASLAGQYIAIHAARTWDPDWEFKAVDFLTPDQLAETPRFRAVAGAVVCVADVAEHRELCQQDSQAALCYCGNGRLYGLVLRTVYAYNPPVTVSGRQGIWEFDHTHGSPLGDPIFANAPARIPDQPALGTPIAIEVPRPGPLFDRGA